MTQSAPCLDEIAALRARLGEAVVRTPVVRCAGLEDLLGNGTTVFGKLEFLQRTGTFKARSALASVLALTTDERAAGITAVSAGNHAIATAYAAFVTGTHARVVMTASASPVRRDACRAFGADVVIADDVHAAFRRVEEIRAQEGRALIHPFEGPAVAAGTGTLGVEIAEQVDDIDAVIVSIGGGGLIGGIANALHQCAPEVDVLGVEPAGADSMSRSLAAGEPVAIERVSTIADSLGAPFVLPFSFDLCRRFVRDVVLLGDDALRDAMRTLFERLRVAVEPACAAATAALLGPYRERLAGRRVVLVFCGSNIDAASFCAQAGL